MKATKPLERQYFHYEELEEYQCGMWRVCRGDERKTHIKAAADLMRDCDGFKKWMREAIEQWPNSCAHNLTVVAANRLAWLGHAGCLLGTGSPEECTRAGWYELTDAERDAANVAAAVVVAEWEAAHEGRQGRLL